MNGLLALMVLVVLAWAACNNRWMDERARPVPEVLKPAPATVPEDRNSFFAFEVLDVPAATDPLADGLRLWRAEEADDTSAVRNLEANGDTYRLVWMDAPPQAVQTAWDCDTRQADCVAVWWGQAYGLATHLDQSALGLRCEGQAQPGMVFDEQIPTPRPVLRTPDDRYGARLARLSTRSQCLRWLHVHAVIAASDGDVATMLRYLGQADALTQALLTGSRTLVSQLTAASMAQRHWRVVTGLAARYPGLAAQLVPLVHPLPEAAQSPAEWMRQEAVFQRELMRELAAFPCDQGADGDSWWDRQRACAQRALFLPNATLHLIEDQWSAALAQAGHGALGMVDWNPNAEVEARRIRWRWRNTAGHLLVESGTPAYPEAVRRQANLILQNEAARLALSARVVPAAAQADWLRQQPMDDRLRDRLSIDNGQVVARGWMTGRPDDTLRFPIPSGVTIATSRADTPTAPTAQARAEPAQAGT